MTDIIANLMKNAENAAKVVRETVVAQMPEARACKCGSALAHAHHHRSPKVVPDATRKQRWTCSLASISV